MQFAQYNHTNQKLHESIFSPTQEKLQNKKPSLLINKTLLTHNLTDKNEMTGTINQNMSLEKKEGQLVTGGIFYCPNSAVIKGCGSLETI